MLVQLWSGNNDRQRPTTRICPAHASYRSLPVALPLFVQLLMPLSCATGQHDAELVPPDQRTRSTHSCCHLSSPRRVEGFCGTSTSFLHPGLCANSFISPSAINSSRGDAFNNVVFSFCTASDVLSSNVFCHVFYHVSYQTKEIGFLHLLLECVTTGRLSILEP